MTEDGVEGMGRDPVLEWAIWRSGEAGLRIFMAGLVGATRLGELFLSDSFLSESWTDTRVGEEGKASSMGFRGTRIRLGEGDPDGLWGRS